MLERQLDDDGGLRMTGQEYNFNINRRRQSSRRRRRRRRTACFCGPKKERESFLSRAAGSSSTSIAEDVAEKEVDKMSVQ